jgi:2-keto-4-pentenoate hydratase/2-oxohepta-3-ene-1,7-dioic acid hydratase in catechol pathway
MKLASFHVNGRNAFGVVLENSVLDLSAAFSGKASSLRDLLGQLDAVEAALSDSPEIPLDEVQFLPVIPEPSKIFCIGVNYVSHLAETGRERPERPMIFTRFANSQTGHGQPMVKPRESSMFDFEGELAVVVGKAGRRIAKEKAFDHVAGYSCYNDGSVRDWQRHTTQFTPGKNFPDTGAFGPCLVTRDEFGDPSSHTIETRLNGEVMQHAGIDDLVFDVPTLIEYCSTFTRLEPGDVIVTGTTGGVGAFRTPPVWMKDGDVVEVEISGIGVLRNPVVGER